MREVLHGFVKGQQLLWPGAPCLLQEEEIDEEQQGMTGISGSKCRMD